ncbi:MAG: Ig-like domain-containing protein [Euryarchaeota archaeon]
MRLYKIASVSIVILLITMVFAGVVAVPTAAAQSTALTLKPSTTTPAVGKSVTFTATLKSGTTLLSSKPVTIYHYLNGVRYTDTTKSTDAYGRIKLIQTFGSTGIRTYYAKFAGDSKNLASTSSAVVVTVKAGSSQLTLSPSTTTPAVGQSVTFTATLKSGTKALSSKPVTIYHYLNGVRYTDTTKTTDAYGRIILTQSFGSAGPRTYYATFSGDNTYKTSSSSVVVITVKAQTTTPTIYYVPQAGSTWVNRGTAGTSYNAYASTPSLYRTQSNGHPYWGGTGRNDFICIPAGSATNNQNVASWEIGFHFSGIASGQRYQRILDKANGGFAFYIDTLYGDDRSYFTIYRHTTGGSHARWYIPTDTVLRTGHDYYIQIAWDSRAGPGNEPYPTVWIGEDGKAPVHQTHWDESGGALGGTGSWYNDSVGPSTDLGNMSSDIPCGSNASARTQWLVGGFYVYRQYNSIVNFSSGGSWHTDKLAWTT